MSLFYQREIWHYHLAGLELMIDSTRVGAARKRAMHAAVGILSFALAGHSNAMANAMRENGANLIEGSNRVLTERRPPAVPA